MITKEQNIILTILKNEYPEIAKAITQLIDQTLPKSILSDYRLIPAIVTIFKKRTGITQVDWTKSSQLVDTTLFDDQKQHKVTEIRSVLIAVMLMLYHPEKLLNVVNENARSGLLLHLSSTLKCNKPTLSYTLSNAIVYYSAYKNFRRIVDKMHRIILVELDCVTELN